MSKNLFKRQVDARWLPGWSAPEGALPRGPHDVQPDPAGNRAERRRAKKLGIKRRPDLQTEATNA